MTTLSLRQQLPNMLKDLSQWRPLPPKRQYLTGLDNIFLAADKPVALMQVSGIYIYESRIDPAIVKTQIEQYCRTTGGRYMQRIVKNEWFLGRPYFEDMGKDFNIDELFEYVKLEGPGSDEQLADIAAREQALDYDYRQPLMKCTYVDGVHGKTFALVWRAHHSVADGQGFVRALITYMAKLDPVTGLFKSTNETTNSELQAMQFKAGRRKSITERAKSSAASFRDTLTWAFALVMGLLLYVFNMLWIMFGATGIRGRKSMWNPDVKKRTGIVPKQIGYTQNISLADIKRAKNVLGCTVNDLLLAATAGGLSKYCKEKGQLKDKNFVMLVPTSMRRPADFAISNESSGYLLTLPMDIEDPQKRVKAVSSRMSTLKKSYEPLALYFGGKIGFTFPWMYPKELLFMSVAKAHGAITNVPGPSQPLMWGGVAISRLIPIIPCNANGIGLAIESYANQVSVGCNLDLDATLPAGAFYGPGTASGICKAIEDEFRRIVEVADTVQRLQIRELVGKVGADVVAKEVRMMQEEKEGKPNLKTPGVGNGFMKKEKP